MMFYAELKIVVFFVLLHLSQSLDCGKVRVGISFIAGGDQSQRGQWPWLASLFMKNSNKFFCGSSIISQKHLLGAAHCFQEKFSSKTPDSNVYAFLGRYDLLNNAEIGSVKRDVAQTMLHPSWKPLESSYDGDIAIILLKLEITFNNIIQPICLPTSSTNTERTKGTVAGYGLSTSNSKHETKPRHVEISSIDHGTCLYSDPTLAYVGSIRMFCAGEVGRNPCKGDSGSGFYVKNGFTWSILGITSVASTDDCGINKYVLFSNVPKYITWITDQITTTTKVLSIAPNRQSTAPIRQTTTTKRQTTKRQITTTKRPCKIKILAGQCLRPGDKIYSCYNCFIIVFLFDGNLAVYTMKEPITTVWSSGTESKGGVRACMQSDGNFVIYTASDEPIWSTRSHNNYGAYAELQIDGQFTIWNNGIRKYASGNLAQCVSKSKLPAKTVLGRNRECNKGIIAGECMNLGDVVYSCHKCFKITLLYDGVLASYTTTNPIRALWSTNTAEKGVVKACMQANGNFVLYTAKNVAIWSTETDDFPGAYAEMQSDGQFAILKDGYSKWRAGPSLDCKTPSNE